MSKPDTRRYSHERYNELREHTFDLVRGLGQSKGGEYSGDDDRLANFRRNGTDQGLPMETIWRVYAAKHWDAIGQYVQDRRNGKKRLRMESISGRVDDLITYLVLFKAMLDEHAEEDETRSTLTAQEVYDSAIRATEVPGRFTERLVPRMGELRQELDANSVQEYLIDGMPITDEHKDALKATAENAARRGIGVARVEAAEDGSIAAKSVPGWPFPPPPADEPSKT